MTRSLLRLILEPAGFGVTEAQDGLEALAQVQQNQPDVVVLDVLMPRLDGLAVCRALRSQAETADLPIIILSTSVQATAVEEGLRAGADKYLFKPISPAELIEHIQDVLQ
jgi:CheY-like chemotaxis protein